MTTELVLLLGLFAFILAGVYLGDLGPDNVFFNSAPRLGARIEQHVEIGHGFVNKQGQPVRWEKP